MSKKKIAVFTIAVIVALVGIFITTYRIRSSQLDKGLEVNKEMVKEMDDNRITYIKITTDGKVYKSVEDYEKVAKTGDIVKCDIVLGNGEHKTALNGYVVKGEHTACRLEGNLVKIIIKGANKNVSK